MPYAFVQDVAATWEQYEQIAAALAESRPAGLIVHLAGPTDEGFRIIGVWESEQSWQQFVAERLAPLNVNRAGPLPPEPTFRELRPAHVVIGGGIDQHGDLAANEAKEEEE